MLKPVRSSICCSSSSGSTTSRSSISPALQAGEVAVGIAAVAVEPATGAIEALDHTSGLQGFEVLVDGGVADVAALGIEALEDVAGAEMALITPEQFQHHPPLAAETHAQVTAAPERLGHRGAQGGGAGS